ncbi:MAG: glycosyltransferase family 4 protein, partial [Bdellovibrionales bacterium]|nr:glycosyltransferase family 4 protein [Bdellovibrionales bacterium]
MSETQEPLSKPRIIQVCLSTAYGGLEMSSVKWTRLFAQAGYSSHLVCIKGSKVAELARSQGLNTVEFDKPANYLSFSARRGLQEVIEKLKPDVFFSHRTKDLWHLSPVLKSHPKIALVSFARMFIRGIKKTDFLHRWIYSRIDKMIALSQIQKSLLLTSLPLEDSKYIVIPNGVDTTKFSPRPESTDIRNSLGLKKQGLLIGLVGRLDIQKGHREFVEAASIIHKKHPEVHFVMVGGENTGEQNASAKEIKAMIEQFQMNEFITITGHRSDIPDILNSLDVFCMPSYEENFGNVMLEAMASGVACVGTNSGGTPEMISEG